MIGTQHVPPEASEALAVVRHALGRRVVAAHLFGSAVDGGLRPDSDVDVLVIIDRRLSEEQRHALVAGLLPVSGRIGNDQGRRPLELTVMDLSDIVPWRYAPAPQRLYGEWLGGELEEGRLAPVCADPDLAIVLGCVRDHGVPLAGPASRDILDTVPMADVRRAIRDSLPTLLAGLHGDERNVLLTLARMWHTAVEDSFAPKDSAAAWAISRLRGKEGALLDRARRAYIGECPDCWDGRGAELATLVGTLTHAVRLALSEPDRSG